MPLKLWLIRHGQCTMNLGEWSNKPALSQLTPLGKEQAKTAAQQVQECPDAIIVSPMLRAKDSAEFLLQQWRKTPLEIWPIQEFIYLSPAALQGLSPTARKTLIDSYWQKNDPLYCDGKDSESFETFLKRVKQFHLQLNNLQGFVVVVGHGQFFKAYQMGLEQEFFCSGELMKNYRKQEIQSPIKNGDIIKLHFS